MSDIFLLVLLTCEFLLIAFGIVMIFAWLTKTPFYPSSGKELFKKITPLEVNLPKGENFLDVGSGDGRIVISAAKNGWNAEGVEYNPFLTLLSRFLIFISRTGKKAKIINKDFKNIDFSKYDLVYLYIFNEHLNEIKTKLFSSLKKGSVVVTKVFKFSKLVPDKTIGKYYVYYVN